MSEYVSAGGAEPQPPIATKSVADIYIDERQEVLADLSGGTVPDLETVEACTLRRMVEAGVPLATAADRAATSFIQHGYQGASAEAVVRRLVADYRVQQLMATALDMGQLFERDEPPLDYVVPGFMVGTYGLLVGAGGGCKSTWAALAAMSVASGRNLLGMLPGNQDTGEPFRVGQGCATFLNLEDHARPLRMRMQMMLRARRDGGQGDFYIPERDRAEIIRASQAGELFILPRPRDVLQPFAVDQNGKVVKTSDYAVFEGLCARSRLLICDTMNILISSAGIDENSNTHMGPAAAALNRTAEETDCAILIPHHPPKVDVVNGTTDSGGRGASAIGDNSRFRLSLRGMTTTEGKERWPNLEGHELDRMRRAWVHAEWSKTSYSEMPYPVWLRRSGVLLEGVPDDLVPKPVPKPAAASSQGSVVDIGSALGRPGIPGGRR